MISGKITTAPRLVSDHLITRENKHQIMNVHTKWNCLMPILSCLVIYGIFQIYICLNHGKLYTAPMQAKEIFILSLQKYVLH